MPMIPYIVKQGDYLAKLAHRMGFEADTVWKDPSNDDLRAVRPNPDMLCPGDILHVPKPEPKSLAISIGSANKYSAQVPMVKVELVIEQEKKPLANADYFIEGLLEPVSGTTKDDGLVSFEAPITTREVAIVFPKQNVRHPVLIGDLDPIEERSGVIMRLAHLGHYGFYPDLDESLDETAHANAIRSFQYENEIPVTGVLDAATRSALTGKHQV